MRTLLCGKYALESLGITGWPTPGTSYDFHLEPEGRVFDNEKLLAYRAMSRFFLSM